MFLVVCSLSYQEFVTLLQNEAVRVWCNYIPKNFLDSHSLVKNDINV